MVTADYHMPRSILELRAAVPSAKLTAYPVVTETLDAHSWWKSGPEARRLTLEYSKYLVILAREGLRGLGGGSPATPQNATEKAPA